MEGTVVAGFEIDSATGQQKPIRIRRLYSTEVVTVGGTDYVVDRFLLKPPGKDTDKELYPVVFKDNILVDKGPAALTLIEKK
jgi:hypothetical protein